MLELKLGLRKSLQVFPFGPWSCHPFVEKVHLRYLTKYWKSHSHQYGQQSFPVSSIPEPFCPLLDVDIVYGGPKSDDLERSLIQGSSADVCAQSYQDKAACFLSQSETQVYSVTSFGMLYTVLWTQLSRLLIFDRIGNVKKCREIVHSYSIKFL